MGTVITILLGAALAGYAIWAALRLKKKGGCGCGCSGCAMSGSCGKRTE